VEHAIWMAVTDAMELSFHEENVSISIHIILRTKVTSLVLKRVRVQ
jgi:hypothetical protein